MADQHEDGGPDPGLGDAEEEADDEQLGKVLDEAAEDGQHAPDEDHDADELLGTPVFGEMAAGDLQRQIADEEDSRGQTLLGRVDAEVLVQAVQGEPDVRPVHERDDVDDDGDRD